MSLHAIEQVQLERRHRADGVEVTHIIYTQVKPDFVKTDVRTRRPAAPSLHSNASSPGMMEVGGFFFEFEPFRTASRRVRATAVAAMA